MKFFCRNDHYKIEGSQVFLVSKSKRQKRLARSLVDTLETQIRQQIFLEICSVPLLEQRKLIVKHGIDNVALQVQDLLARVALKKNPEPERKNVTEGNSAVTIKPESEVANP